MGRPRKPSTSTVATIDRTHFRWARETAVLKSTPKDINDNEWPILVLHDAVIYEKDGKTIGNPLFLDSVGPMVVRGRIVRNDYDHVDGEEDEEKEAKTQIQNSFLKPNMKAAYIEISASTRYSIGFTEYAELWVSGEAGWYGIEPAPEYEAKYLEICEAIDGYYHAMTVFEEYEREKLAFMEAEIKRGKKQKKPSIGRAPPVEPTLEDVFFRYAKEVGDGVTRDEAEARYRKWAPFYAFHFPKESNFRWEGTCFAKWIHQVCLEKKGMTARAQPPAPAQRASSSRRGTLADDESQVDMASERRSRSKSAKARQTDDSQDVEMTDVSSQQTQQLAIRRIRSFVETPVPLPPQYRLSQLATPAPSTPVQPAPPRAASVATTPGPTSPVEVLLDVLNEIATDRDLTRTKAGTVHTQLYMLCRIKPYKAAAEVTAFYAKELFPRLPPVWKGTDFYNYLQQASKKPPVLELTTAEEIPAFCERRNKAPQRLPRGPRNRPSLQGSQDRSDSEEDSRSGRRARKSGKAAGLRLASSSKKRPASDIDIDSRYGGHKAAKLSHPTTEDEEDSSEESDDESVLNALDDHDKTGFLVSPPPDAVRVVVNAERIPTMSPTGPNGTWVCDQEGCGHIIRAANEPLGEELIQIHFRHHEAQAERMSLAMKESRGHSINHLLDKIQAIGKKTMDFQTGGSNGDEAPAPVKRRLLL